MLEIVRYNVDEYDFPCLIALGCFDGLHIGHAALLKKAKLQAKINGLDLGVMMFSGGKGGEQVFTFEERLKFLEQFNVKFVLKIDFDEQFKNTKPLDFLKNVEEKINVKAYMSGKDFRFGAGAKGKSSTLKKYAEDDDSGVWYESVKDVVVDGKKVSTSDIKELLENGSVEAANTLLGRSFTVCGAVVKGADRGEKLLGCPTMNIVYPENKVKIKQGVYAVQCCLGESAYTGIANFGARPTFEEENPVLEVHLDGFDGDVYGEEVTVEFIKYLRDIRKFASAEELQKQLARDMRVAKGEEVAETAAEEQTPVEETPVAVAEEAVVTEEVTEAPAEAESVVMEEVTEAPAEAEAVIAEEVTGEPAEAEAVVTEEVTEEPAEAEVLVTEEVTEAPAEEEAVVTEEVTEAPVEEEAVVTEEVTEEPAEAEAVVTEEVTEEPAEAETVVTEEVEEEPVEAEAVVTEEVTEAPAEEEAVVTEEVTEEPAEAEVVVAEEEAEEPAEAEAVVSEEVTEAPAEAEAVVTEEVTEAPAEAEEAVAEEVAEEPAAEIVEAESAEERAEEVTPAPLTENVAEDTNKNTAQSTQPTKRIKRRKISKSKRKKLLAKRQRKLAKQQLQMQKPRARLKKSPPKNHKR